MSMLGRPEAHVQIDLSAFFQPLLTDIDDARAFVTAGLRVDVVGGLYFTTTYNFNHDSRPPAGVVENDQSIRSGLGWKF